MTFNKGYCSLGPVQFLLLGERDEFFESANRVLRSKINTANSVVSVVFLVGTSQQFSTF